MTETKTTKKPLGRPRKTPEGCVNVCITIPLAMREKLRRLGNSRWVVEQLQKTVDPLTEQRTKEVSQ